MNDNLNYSTQRLLLRMQFSHFYYRSGFVCFYNETVTDCLEGRKRPSPSQMQTLILKLHFFFFTKRPSVHTKPVKCSPGLFVKKKKKNAVWENTVYKDSFGRSLNPYLLTQLFCQAVLRRDIYWP